MATPHKSVLSSAEQGFDKAQRNLALMYEMGIGLRLDLIQAYKWYSLAGEAGNRSASQDLERLAPRLTVEQIGMARSLVKDRNRSRQSSRSPGQALSVAGVPVAH